MFKNKFGRAARAAQKQELGAVKQNYFTNCHRTYSCIHCRAHLANHDELVSKLFLGNNGRAYLFNKVVNVGCKQAVKRELITGLHAVADIYCDNCQTTLGWKYEQAFVASQKYKEGKYIIELAHMLKENQWDLTSYNARELLREENRISRTNQFDVNSFKVGDSDIRLKKYNDCYGDIEIRNYPIASPKKELVVLKIVNTKTVGDEEQQQQQKRQVGSQQLLEQIPPPPPSPILMKKNNNNNNHNIDSNRNSNQISDTTVSSPASEEIELLEVSIDRMCVSIQKGLEIPQTFIKTENTSLGSSLSHSQSDSNLCCSSSSSTGSH